MSTLRETLRGIIAMLVASAAFIANDTFAKLASEDLGLGQIMLVRGLIASVVVLTIAGLSGAFTHWRQHVSALLAWRTLGEVLATLLYLVALFNMPIANSTAIMQAVPLVMTAAGAIFLKEVVGWRRWAAVLVGFAGILLIVRPGPEGFNIYAVIALAAMFAVALRDLLTRRMALTVPTLFVASVTIVTVTIVGGVLAVAETAQGLPMVAMTMHHFVLLAAAAACVIVAYVLIVVAMRNGEVATVAQFRYAQVLWAIVAGFLIWGQIPDMPTLIGIAIVVCTGIYTVHRERVRARDHLRAAANPAP
ncbi:DMT family transporter [Methylobrevis albus]|uniref:DMT family transporter n=1 Tax=Methylobrevis albus TaxID=2793297 RepID=A0A931I139_9HYPH|nr:DMT family transporter [Methylobrevis albus]MBH0237036.1 DMT family transporter [Methylobrevis albus]